MAFAKFRAVLQAILRYFIWRYLEVLGFFSILADYWSIWKWNPTFRHFVSTEVSGIGNMVAFFLSRLIDKVMQDLLGSMDGS